MKITTRTLRFSGLLLTVFLLTSSLCMANAAAAPTPSTAPTLASSLPPGPTKPTFIPSPPNLSAKSYILMDYNSGNILAESNSDARVEPASLTKIMTVYIIDKALASGQITMEQPVLISEKAWRAEGSRMFIEVNNHVPVSELLKGIIIQSGNDASIAMAEAVAGTESAFAEMMNAEAKRLGMNGSHFVNATGLPDPDHYTTAKDMAILAQAMIHDYPKTYAIYSEKEFYFNNIKQINRNRLLWRNDTVDGIKTGHTDNAGYCLVSSAKQNDMRLISVVMGTDSDSARADQSDSLLRYGFSFYETTRLYTEKQPLEKIDVWMGAQNKLPVGLQNDLYITVPKGKKDQLTSAIKTMPLLKAPIEQYQNVGEIDILLDGKPITSTPLYALEAIAQGSKWQRMKDFVHLKYLGYFNKDKQPEATKESTKAS